MGERDDAWIAQYLDGDAAAFERLYDRYAPRLLGFLVSLGAGRDAAEDLAQRAWMKAIGAFEDYEPRGRFRPWLFTLAHRLWIDEARSAWERRRAAAEDGGVAGDPADPGDGPRERAIRSEERGLVEEALVELPEAMREVVLLRIDGELTYREIAERTDSPLGTVLWRMSEAQKRLRERLGAFAESGG